MADGGKKGLLCVLLTLSLCCSLLQPAAGLLPPVILKPSVRDPSYQWRIIGSSTSGSTLNTQECVVKGNYRTVLWEGVNSNYVIGTGLPGGWRNGNVTQLNDTTAVRQLISDDNLYTSSSGIFRCVVTYRTLWGTHTLISAPIQIDIAYIGMTGKPFFSLHTRRGSLNLQLPCINRQVYGTVHPSDLEDHVTFTWMRDATRNDAWPEPSVVDDSPVNLTTNITSAGGYLLFSPLQQEDTGFTNGTVEYSWRYSCIITAKPPANFQVRESRTSRYLVRKDENPHHEHPEVTLVESSRSEMSAIAGEEVEAFCLFTADIYGFPLVNWTFGEPPSTSHIPHGFTQDPSNRGASIKFLASEETEGAFRCTVGKISNRFFLTVHARPSPPGPVSEGVLTDQTVGLTEGQPSAALFVCKLSEEPRTSSVKWLVNGNIVWPTERHALSGSSYHILTIRNLTTADEGSVSCLVTDDISGPYLDSASLTIYADPLLTVSHTAPVPEAFNASNVTGETFTIMAEFSQQALFASPVASWVKRSVTGTELFLSNVDSTPVPAYVSMVSWPSLHERNNFSLDFPVIASFEVRLTSPQEVLEASGRYTFELTYLGGVVYRSEPIAFGINLEFEETSSSGGLNPTTQPSVTTTTTTTATTTPADTRSTNFIGSGESSPALPSVESSPLLTRVQTEIKYLQEQVQALFITQVIAWIVLLAFIVLVIVYFIKKRRRSVHGSYTFENHIAGQESGSFSMEANSRLSL